MPGDKKTICIDFDLVIHSESGIGQDVADIRGEILPGAAEAIRNLREEYQVVVLTSRAEKPQGRRAVGKWLKDHGIMVDAVTDRKVPAVAYVDDRAIHFYGDWEETLKDIKHFRPWRGGAREG